MGVPLPRPRETFHLRRDSSFWSVCGFVSEEERARQLVNSGSAVVRSGSVVSCVD